MSTAQLPVPIPAFGIFATFGNRVHHLTAGGRNVEALALADELEPVARVLDDDRGIAMIVQGRMYALAALERLPEALATGDALLASHQRAGARINAAKALADTAQILIRMGRLDEGLYRLASATVVLDSAPREHVRYGAALSSVCGAAQSAQLYELADEVAARALAAFQSCGALNQAASLGLQRAEVLLDWALGLERVGLAEDAARYYTRSVTLTRRWLADHARDAEDAPLAAATLAVGLAKLGRYAEAETLACDLIVPMRETHHVQEARRAHLAYGLVLRSRSDYPAARREFLAAEELAEDAWQRLTFQFELAMLVAAEHTEPTARAIRTALAAQARYMWRLRLERRVMMQQARRRVEMEAAQAAADRAAAQDALTGLGNRRQFDREIASLDESYVLVLIDVDHFKSINDNYSHRIGDRILCEVAATLRAHCRGEDCAVRLGGDEFALFLRTDLTGAARVADRIREVLAARDWTAFGAGLRVTLSVGLAQCARGMDGSTLYDHADRQLYNAKRAGRDRVAG
jgi:diguanylate cyclase (GGDEF)-like protein